MNAESYIDTESYDDVLSHELTQFLVREAVGVAMESPLRESILEGVERGEREFDGVDVSAGSEEPEAGGRSLPVKGLVVLAVLGFVLYASLGRRGGE